MYFAMVFCKIFQKISSPLRPLKIIPMRQYQLNMTDDRLNYKQLLWPIWNIFFCKMLLYFDILIWSPRFRIFIMVFYLQVKIRAWIYISRIHFDCGMICILLLTMPTNLSICTFFILMSYVYRFHFLMFF